MANLNGGNFDLSQIAKEIEAHIAHEKSGPCELALRLKKEAVDAGL